MQTSVMIVSTLSHHISCSTPEPTLEHSDPGPLVAGPTPLRARTAMSLFQSLLKLTSSGLLAIQETSAGFRRSGTNAAAVGLLGIQLNDF